MGFFSSIRGLNKGHFIWKVVGLVACFFHVQTTQGQSTLQIEFTPSIGHQQNIYGAPGSFQLTGTDSLATDTILVNDNFHQEVFRFAFLFENSIHKLNWENKAILRTYRNFKSGNTRDLSSQLNYAYTSKSKLVAGGSVLLRSFQGVGLDLITTDLLIPQDKTVLRMSFFTGLKGERNTLLFAPTFFRERYEPCYSCAFEERVPSLSHNTWRFTLSDTVRVGNASDQQKFGFGISWSNRRFIDWQNTQLLNPSFNMSNDQQFLPYDPNQNYDEHHWRFIQAAADYTFPLNEKSKLVPFLIYEQRLDLGHSDYGRNDLTAGMSLKWKNKHARIKGTVAYSNQRFIDRLTLPTNTTGQLSLDYTLAHGELQAAFNLTELVLIEVGGSYQSRTSNQTNEGTLSRRSFERWALFGGLKFVVETERSGRK